MIDLEKCIPSRKLPGNSPAVRPGDIVAVRYNLHIPFAGGRWVSHFVDAVQLFKVIDILTNSGRYHAVDRSGSRYTFYEYHDTLCVVFRNGRPVPHDPFPFHFVPEYNNKI